MYEATAKRIEQAHTMDSVKGLIVRYLRIYGQEVLKRVSALLCVRSARTLLVLIREVLQRKLEGQDPRFPLFL